MKQFSKVNQIIFMFSIYLIATVCTLLFEFKFKKIKKFLYKEPIPKVLTNWQITHFLTRVLLGFFAPDLWYIIIGLDVSWEILEYFKWKNENWFDLIFNLIGQGIGIGLNKLVTKG